MCEALELGSLCEREVSFLYSGKQFRVKTKARDVIAR